MYPKANGSRCSSARIPHRRRPPSSFGTAFLVLSMSLVFSSCSGKAASQDHTPEEPTASTVTENRDQVLTPPKGHAWVIFGADTVVAEVARTPEERQQGLMYREELAEGRGMIFVFDRSEPRSFWMQNTYLALDIAYIDAGKRIMDILAMEPLSNDLYESSGPALFALEVPQGWFAKKGIVEGDIAKIVFGP